MDVGYSGNWLTWERGNLPKTNIQEHLDRRFQFNIFCTIWEDNWEDNWLTGKKFKFEAWWVLEESFAVEVKHIWERTTGDLLQKLESLRKGLERWAARIRQNIKRKNEFLSSRLSELMRA
ncbi:hypothetical protein EPI10_027118 [Gossypium australe]|uniref:Reverse transcriptase n=1 Tax=Gossypium australe TaxID=47621 RepID=A0A5B6UQY8_9ROSI|nr:hypothetical protein EPI10_027118 [Gossypium australe]